MDEDQDGWNELDEGVFYREEAKLEWIMLEEGIYCNNELNSPIPSMSQSTSSTIIDADTNIEMLKKKHNCTECKVVVRDLKWSKPKIMADDKSKK